MNDIDHDQESYWFNIDHLQPLNKAKAIFVLLCSTCILTSDSNLLKAAWSWRSPCLPPLLLDPGLTCLYRLYLYSAGHGLAFADLNLRLRSLNLNLEAAA